MTPEEIFQKLARDVGPDAVSNFDAGQGKAKDAFCEVAPGALLRVCQQMKSDPELAFDYLECVTGIDLLKEQQIQVVYHVYSYGKRHRLVLKVSLDRAAPVLASVTPVWSAANWLERECFDLLGVTFEGHPDLRRLLLPPDWVGHPLRKDWTPQAEYHGIPTTRPDPLALLAKAPKAEAKPAAKAEEPKADEPKAEKPKAEKPKAEKPKAEKPKADEPKEPAP
jgi:NADH-quinone oxidoreductase subunit C